MKRSSHSSSDQEKSTGRKKKKLNSDHNSLKSPSGAQEENKAESVYSVPKSLCSSDEKEINSDTEKSHSSEVKSNKSKISNKHGQFSDLGIFFYFCYKFVAGAEFNHHIDIQKNDVVTSTSNPTLKKEISASRNREPIVDNKDWKTEEFSLKHSRIDSKKYQVDVPDEPTGTNEELEMAIVKIKARCTYDGQNLARKAIIEEFLKFVRWFLNERANAGFTGPYFPYCF